MSIFVAPHVPGISSFYFRSLCLEFSIGIGCAALVASPRFAIAMRFAACQWSLVGIGIAAFVAGMAADSLTNSAGTFCGLGAGAIIIGLVALEQSGRINVPNSLVFLGGASYSIYLVHFSAITLFAALMSHVHAIPHNNVVFGAAAALGISSGLVFDQIIDRPIQRLLRKRIKPALSNGKPAY